MKVIKVFFVIWACFTALFFSAVKGYSQASCPDPVMIAEDGLVFNTIQEAYNDASLRWTNFTLLLVAETFNEDLNINGGSALFDGGYDCSFSTKNLSTGIIGSITISSGAVTFDNIGLLALPVCAFDSDGDGFTSIGSCAGSADDCDDNNANVFPGATEICDGLDNNCDGQIDEGLLGVDLDGDGYSAIGSCDGSADDCNDIDYDINPGATEILGDDIDQDCDGYDLIHSYEYTCIGCHGIDAHVLNNQLHQSVAAPDVTCADCHDARVNGVLPGHYGETVVTAGNNMAAGEIIICTSCHDWHEPSEYDVGNADVVWSKVYATWVGFPTYDYVNLTCDTCHENQATFHAAKHTVEVGPNDLSQTPPGMLCTSCHVVANWSEIDGITHNVATNGAGSCSTCHNSLRQEVIDAIYLSYNPTPCLDCHSDKELTVHGTVQNVDHVALGYMTQAANCGGCHDATLGTPFVDPTDNMVHDTCTTCHVDPDNNDFTLVAAASGGVGGGDCTVCHSSDFTGAHPEPTVDHTSLINIGATGCVGCHSDPPPLVDAGDATNHNGCSSCHDVNGALISSAIGKTFGAGGDCATCHTGTWGSTHTTDPGHTGIIVGATSCSGCHDDTLVSAAADTHNACTSCHDDATGVLIGSAVGNPTPTDCTTCHTGTWETEHPEPTADHTSLVTVGATSCSGCHDDTLVSAAAETHNGCSSCHDAATGALISSAIGKTFGAGGDCATCHTGTWGSTHTTDPGHTGIIVGATSCSGCHDDTLVSAAADTHNACTSCHDDATGVLIGSAVGNPTPTDCTTCHTGTWETEHPEPTVDHTSLINIGATGCVGCHSDPPPLVDAGDATNHNGCSSCHDAATGALISSAIGKTFGAGGDCATCHTGTWGSTHTTDPGHTGIIVGATSCSGCHDDTLVSAAADTHIACTSCHDNATGVLIGSAVGNPTPTDCTTCHTGTWETEHPEPTADHTSLVIVGATSCSGCHDDTLVSAAADTHNGCSSCHDAATGALISSAIGKTFGAGGDCATCHTGTFDALHAAHVHTVAEGPGDLSYDPPGTLCSSCHVVADWTEIDGVEHNVPTNGAGSCATCHNSSRQEVIDAISLGADPTNCLNCHSNKELTVHGNMDHVALGYVTVGATSCASCHDPGAAANATVTITHNGNCGLCHTTVPDLQPGVPAGGGDCVTCHNSDFTTVHPEPTADHTSLVTVGTTGCADCHIDPPPLVDAGDAANHNTCSSCHDSNGALISSAIGKTFAAGGDCATCHTGTWDGMHTTDPGHTGITVGATSCATCHDDTLVSAAPETHNGCTSCHDAGSGALIGSAIGNPSPTDCTTCHTGTWSTIHPTTGYSHTGITVGATSCATCHDDTLVSAAPETHNGCTSCHDAGTGVLIGSAVGNPTPTDCTTCHTGTWDGMHTTDPGHTGITVGATGCATCHDDTLVSAAPETHNACTSCHDAGSGALIGSAIGNPTPTDCTTCHTGTWDATHTTDPGHTGITVGATGCATCHDDTLVSAAPETHNGCTSCHDAGSGALIGSAIGNPTPTDCTTCHTGTWDATHTTDPGHTGITVGATGCADCHSDTPFIDAGDATNHNSCTSCHDAGSGALIGSAIGNPTPTDCTTCHTGTWSTIHPTTGYNHAGITVGATGCATCHDDTLVSAAPETHNACTSCHDAGSGALIGSAIGNPTPTDCTTCHTGTWGATHTNDPGHTGIIVGATGCATCHDDTLVSAAPETHNACTSCHDAGSGALIGSAIGNPTPTDCTTCHTGTWDATHTTDPGHTGITVGATGCADCHSDTPFIDAGDATNHNSCTSCHDAGSGALIGSAIGNPTPTDCTTCHTGTWSTIHPTTGYSHAGITVGATGCATCHDDTLVSAAPETHNACTSCHDAGSGALIGSAIGNPAPTDCTTCHTGTWGATHTNDPGHTGIIVGATGCATCHDDTLVSAAPETHNGCTSCHDAGSGALIGSAIGNPTPTDCTTCHTGTWDATHTTDPGHTGITVGATGCATCHDDTLVSAAPETHNACTSCHDAGSGALIGSAIGNPTPTDCTTCHTGTWSTIHPTTGYSHAGITVGATGCATCHDDTLVSAAPETHNACTSCHDAGSGALIGSAIGNPTPTDCTTCHTGTWGATHTNDPGHTGIIVGATGCATCHDDTLVSAAPETHNACTSCHDAGSGALIGSAIGNPTPTDCTTCHTGTWDATHTTDPGHTGIIVGATGCATCHDDTLVSAAPETHNGCTSCHDAGSGALIGSAIGNPTPTDCTTCHTGTWDATHTTDPGHTGITVGATGCAPCHDDTLVSAAPETHNACTSCHDAGSGALIGSAIGNPTPTDCTTCHTGTWSGLHTTDPGHTGITVGATSCAGCHDNTLVSPAADTHNACTSCHNAGTGALIGSALGNPIPTNCTTCHSGTWEALHPTTAYGHTDIVATSGTTGAAGAGPCGTCHSDPPPLVDAGDTKVHNACVSCHDSIDGSLISIAAGTSAPGNCETCHINKEAHGSIDHEALGYIMDSSTIPGCQSCHVGDTSAGGVHSDCSNCHTATPPDLKSSPSTPYTSQILVGGGACEDCHNGHNIVEEAGIDVAQTPPQMCGECHGGTDRRFSDFSEIKQHHYNHCQTCHESTDPTVLAVVDQYDGGPNHVNCSDCHTTVGDHSGHPLIKAGIRGSVYSDDAIGQQSLTCFAAGCHASNTVKEHLTPRGIAYKNFENKYGQPFTCELCHENKYPVDVIQRGKVCSDPAYTDQASCEAASPRWMQTVGQCSDPQYPDQASCEAGTLSWNDLVFNSDPIINAAIANGIAGNYVYCSDCHQESVTRFDKGECSDSAHVNEVECEFMCTDPAYTTQVDCLVNGESWNVPTGETWTPAGYCNDIRFSDEASCVAGGEPVWFAATLACSDPQFPDQTSCENAVTTPVWYLVMPYSIHDKYNGVGIYSFSEKHHEAEIWTGTCSNAGITDEDACYADGSTWSPSYTPGVSFVGNGECTVCHKDPREQPYAHDVCTTTRYATATACISAGLASYGGSCSIPEYLNTYDCTDNGGTWSGGICMDYQYTDQTSCEAGDPGYTSWIAHPAGAGKILPMPKQLPCVDCHAKIDAVGNTMTIYKEKIGTQVDPYGTYGGWVRSETGHIANTVDHVCADDNYTTQQACDPVSDHSWYEPLGVCVDSTYADRASCDAAPNHHWETPCSDNAYDDQDACVGTWEGVEHKWAVDGGNIQDYGACLFCHKMRPYHAYPGPPPDDPDTNVVDDDFYDDGYADPPHYPCYGRGSLGVFFGKHRKPFKYYQSTGQSSYKNDYKAIRDADALPDDTISWWSNIIYDPQDDPTGMVPTTSFCSDPTILTRSECENTGNWWRPAHIMGTPEYFTIPTFDPPINNPIDAITITNGTGYSSNSATIDVEAEVDVNSTGTIYAVWSGKAKLMNLDSSGGGVNTWLVTFTAADGVHSLGDSSAGRVYVISVDETSDNHDLLYQAFTDL